MLGFAWFMLLLSAGNARAVLEVGEAAPPLTLPNAAGEAKQVVPKPGRALLLFFVKPEDRHTSTALVGAASMLARETELTGKVDPCVVVLRHGEAKLPVVTQSLNAPWQVLVDSKGDAFEGYKIIATPTAVIVGENGRAAAVHPGYDPALLQDLRLELARLLKIELPATARGEKAPPPDMNLGLARRLAGRRMWDEALQFYGKAAATHPLAPEDQLAVARIQLEISQPDAALQALNAIPTTSTLAAQAADVRKKAEALKSTLAAAPNQLTPPAVP